MRTSPVRVKARTHSLHAVERYRRAQLFEAADVAYRRAGAKRDPALDAWENALADGLPER